MGMLWSMLGWKRSDADDNVLSETENMAAKRPRSSSKTSTDSTSPDFSGHPVIQDEEEEDFWKKPDFGVMTTEAPESTPENRRYDLDAGVLLAIARWGLQRMYLKEVKYLVPLPWKPEIQYNTMHQFINIEIELMDRSGQRAKRMVPGVENLWDALDNEGKDNRPRHMMFRGEAGSGKTTFFRWFIYNWIKEKQLVKRLNFQDTIMLYYDLRNLMPDDDLNDDLLKLLHTQSTLNSTDSGLTAQCIPFYRGEVVLLLDSYDSLPDSMRQKVKDVLRVAAGKKNQAFRICTICIISRFETDTNILYMFDRQFRFKGFTKENVNNFLLKHLGSDLPRVMAAVQKYELERIFDFVGLAPVTILILVEELNDMSDLDGQYDLIFRVIMSLARRSNGPYKLGLDVTQIKEKLFHLGEWFRICSIVNETSFREEEFIKYMGSDYEAVMRIGIIKNRVNPPLCMDRYFQGQHIMYWKVIESYYIRERWLSRINDSEREHFVEQFDPHFKTTISIFIFRIKHEMSRVCVRLIGSNSNVCFDWAIFKGNIVKFAVNLEPFKDYEPENEGLRISIEFENSKDGNIESVMDTFHSLMLTSKGSDASEKILQLLRSFKQKYFIVSFFDCISNTTTNTSQSWKLLETIPVATVKDKTETLSFDNIPFTSSLLNVSLRLQINVGRPWTSARHCDKVLRQLLNFETTLEENDDNVHMYLHGILMALRSVNRKAALILKFKDTTQNYTILINKEPNKVLICDTVYCSVIHSFTAEEVLNNRHEFSVIQWKNCYGISLRCTK